MIKLYSLAKDGSLQLTKNFKVREFACPDGSDIIYVDDVLVNDLQLIRNRFGRISIGSGYRTVSWNKAIGGDPYSGHLTGEAADIDVFYGESDRPVDAVLVAMYCESMGVKRIGLYTYANGENWIHVGSKSVKRFYRQRSAGGYKATVTTFLPTLRRQLVIFTNSEAVKIAQKLLNGKGYYNGPLDGKYGPGKVMYNAVRRFQSANSLQVDGNIGPTTWKWLLM